MIVHVSQFPKANRRPAWRERQRRRSAAERGLFVQPGELVRVADRVDAADPAVGELTAVSEQLPPHTRERRLAGRVLMGATSAGLGVVGVHKSLDVGWVSVCPAIRRAFWFPSRRWPGSAARSARRARMERNRSLTASVNRRAARDRTGELEMGKLVFADRDNGRLAEENVGGLMDRVGEHQRRHRSRTRGDHLVLDGRVARQLGDADEAANGTSSWLSGSTWEWAEIVARSASIPTAR